MKSISPIRHYASKQDYLNRKPKLNKPSRISDLAQNKKSSIEDKVKDVGDKIKDKTTEAKSAGKHLLSQVVSAGLKSLPIPNIPILPSIPDISIGGKSPLTQIKSQRSPSGPIDKPVVFFVKGFEINPFADDFNSVAAMASSIPGSKVFNWSEGDEVVKAIKEHAPDQPVILVGEGMGSDTLVDVTNRLNTAEGNFRNVDLLVTLNSVGTDNDIISNNVKRNINFISDEDSLFNDGPNIARDKTSTVVTNELRYEGPSELGESSDIQFTIFQYINETLADAVVKKEWHQMQASAFKDNLKALAIKSSLFT